MSVATAPELVTPNPAEINSKVTTPDGNHEQLVDEVVSNVNAAKPNILPFTKAQATPPEKQSIPKDNSGHIQPGIHTEPLFDTADITDRTKRFLGNAASEITGDKGLLGHGETVSGHKFTSKLKEMVRKRLHLQKAA